MGSRLSHYLFFWFQVAFITVYLFINLTPIECSRNSYVNYVVVQYHINFAFPESVQQVNQMTEIT